MTALPLPARPVLDALPPAAGALLARLAGLVGPGARVALVGGAVRDALMGVDTSSPDLDFVVEGADVRSLAEATGLPHVWHPAYGNATLTLGVGHGESADVVSARDEVYPVPGAAPAVWPADLAADLRRRDFGLNALALVAGEDALHGPPGADRELETRVLRPLSPHSLRDDASRLVRGARLAGRLGLTAHPELLAQVPAALEIAAQTPRLDAELRLLLQEARPGAAASVLDAWGAGTLLPDGAPARLARLDAQVPGAGLTLRAAALLELSGDPQSADAQGLAARLNLGVRPLELLSRAQGDRPFPPGTPETSLRALLGLAPVEALTGRALLAGLGGEGLRPGPAVGALMAWLREQRRAGTVRTEAEEWAAARAFLASGRGRS